ncbi:MAG TPA: hypothetical protein PLT82_10730 [Candidatus Hydrogenedens sp.]|nr:hypothetical protein [Candidatus Hydrogenedens sp.]
MFRIKFFFYYILLTFIFYSVSGYCWGPTAQISIISNAIHLLDKELNTSLKKLEEDLKNGAGIPDDVLYSLVPTARTDIVRAIETEINLLIAVKPKKIDPYYAYRLGILGKLTAQATSPLQNADLTIQTLYNADVEKMIEKVSLRTNPRQRVNPSVYFSQLSRQISSRDTIFEQEYKSNVGFRGTASTTLPECVSISLNAVADVWYTVLIPNQTIGNVGESALREYALQGGLFYAKRGNPEEIKLGIQKLSALVPFTEDMYIQLGDTLMQTGLSELAVEQYQMAIQLNPNRREIARKIADYYVDKGNKSREAKKLEEALDWFKNAVTADPLHPEAERLRLDTERDIKERDARLAMTKEALERADKLQNTAEQEALSGHIAEAIVLLRQALATYDEVTDEFPLENQQKGRGIRYVNNRIQELKGQLLDSAKNFSGKYPDFDLMNTLTKINNEISNYLIQEKIEQSFQSEIQSILSELPSEITDIK